MVRQEVSGLYSVSEIYKNSVGAAGTAGFATYKGDYFINNNEAGSDGSAGMSSRIENNKYQLFLNSTNNYINITEDDTVLFDVVSGNSITGYYNASDAHYTGEYLNKDIYLNGQKLTSGIDYDASTHNSKPSVKLESSALNLTFPDGGDLFFVPHASSDFTVTTSSGGGKEFTVSNIFFEQVWVNGIRQVPGVDYYKVPDNSLVSSTTPSLENNSFDFESNNNAIDVSVKDRINPVSAGKKRNRIFEFDSEGNTNLFVNES